MRPSKQSVVVLGVLVPLSAFAGSHVGGDDDGGGALAHVSAGLGGAASAGGHSSAGEPVEVVVDRERDRHRYVEVEQAPYAGGLTLRPRPVRPEPPLPAARVEAYIGAQKVHDSDGAFTAELAFVDRRIRIGGTYSRYYEAQPGRDALTLSVPTLTLGARVAGDGASKVYVVAGLAGASTANDKTMDSSFVGVVGGVRVETPLASSLDLVGEAQLMQFGDGVRATAARAGLKVGPLQASLRVLDFNVGPPLWGPELGVGF